MIDWKTKRIVVAGRFKFTWSDDLKARLRQLGATVSDTVTRKTDFIVAGPGAGARLAMARTMKIPVADEAQIQAMLKGEPVVLTLARETSAGPAEKTTRVLEDLRQHLYQTPTSKTWDKICAALDKCSSEDLPMAIDYIQQGTVRWPCRLTTLNVPSAQVRDVGVVDTSDVELRTMPRKWRKALLSGEYHPKYAVVQTLTFSNERVNNTLARNILACPHLTGLRELTLKGNLSPKFARELAETTALPALTHLDISGLRFGEEGIEALCAHPAMGRLEHLSLNNNALSVLPLDLPKNLESLDLSWLSLVQWDHARLARTLRGLERLKALSLSWNRLTQPMLQAILRGSLLERLDTLSIAGNDLGLQGIRGFLKIKGLENLRVLDLCNTAFGDTGARLLANAPQLAGLEQLWLGATGGYYTGNNMRISAKGFEALRQSRHLSDAAKACLKAP